MKKLIILFTVLTVIFSFSLPAFALDSDNPGQLIENGINTDVVTDTVVSNSETKDDAITKSDVASFKGKFTALFAELNILRTECKDLWTQIKSTNQSIKTELKSLKEELKGKDKTEAKNILSALKAKIEPLRTQVKALHADIKSLREQKKTEWTNFRSAVKARDEAKASSSLNKIIDLKKQIIEKQKELLPLKQQILDAIKA
jgi:Zn-ribbon protein, possibly nucleic acid-binding